ncbi:MAG TPA: alpha/beta hydrolase, partial [Dehalococcoidia bacterium]|nr:alpha/beta hydrolase [Dehalococcoidia bacterium]
IHVFEEGNPQGRPILLIHGFSQCYLTWSKQLDSDLTREFRVIAMDMRGHGESEKPRDAYADSKLWADDVQGVIETLGLDGAILSGWSYGALVFLDYIRHYGEDRIGGVHFVNAISKLGSDEALSVISPEFLSLVPGFFSTNIEESVPALYKLLQLCFVKEPPVEELYRALGYNVLVPPYVRQGLLSRSLDNDDLLPQIRKPVLITHGAKDAAVLPAVVDQHKAVIRHAQVQMIQDAGHASFCEEPETFNRALREFIRSLG